MSTQLGLDFRSFVAEGDSLVSWKSCIFVYSTSTPVSVPNQPKFSVLVVFPGCHLRLHLLCVSHHILEIFILLFHICICHQHTHSPISNPPEDLLLLSWAQSGLIWSCYKVGVRRYSAATDSDICIPT